MRFYDPDFGKILIDGRDIRKYNILNLRQRMGLVMQESTLFNYSVKENILYGNLLATNEDIVNAAEIANAREFIESDTLQHQLVDDPTQLLNLMKSSEYKAQVLDDI